MINYNQRDIADNPLISVMIEFPSSRNGNMVRTPVIVEQSVHTPGKIWLFPDSLESPIFSMVKTMVSCRLSQQNQSNGSLSTIQPSTCTQWENVPPPEIGNGRLGAFTDWLHVGFLWKLQWLIPYLDVTRISRSVVSSWVNTAYYSSNNWITGMSWDINR